MKVLVTGASGLIGGEVLNALADAEVIAVTKGATTAPHGVFATVTLDLRHEASVRALVEHVPEVIVHAAAVLPSALSGADAENAAKQNRAIDDVVLAAVRITGSRMIYLSGTSLYGCVQHSCTEESKIHPRGPYLEEKRRSEEMTLDDGRGAVLRVSSPYGAGQRARTVLLKFVHQAMNGEDLRFYGTGAREQDFVAAEDVARAVVAAAHSDSHGIFNVATGEPISMKELAGLVIRTVGSHRSRAMAAGRDDPEEDCRARFDVTRARRELRWQPTMDLATGIRTLASHWSRAVDERSEHPGS